MGQKLTLKTIIFSLDDNSNLVSIFSSQNFLYIYIYIFSCIIISLILIFIRCKFLVKITRGTNYPP